MRLALAQYALGPEMQTNLEKALHFMEAASRRGADMILFPEICLSPFFPRLPAQDASRYAVQIDAPCIREFKAACRRLRLAASPNVHLEEGSRRFDASLLIDPDGEIRGISKMVHIAQVPGFYEQDYYTPSDTGFRVYAAAAPAKIGVIVCFDRHYPESTRTCVLRGADLIVIATANTMDELRDLFDYELRVAAYQNGVYIAMCNRVGREGETVFCGESMVVDPDGGVVVKASAQEDLIVADLDLSRVEAARNQRPYLALRRPEEYE